MPTTVKTVYGTRIAYREVNPCTNVLSQSFATATKYQTIVSKLERESRPKPTTLIGALTPRAKQYIQNTNYMWLNHVVVSKVNCYPGYKTKYRYEEMVQTPNFPALPVAPVCDWGEAMRLKIKSYSVNYADAIGEWKESVRLVGDAVTILRRAQHIAKWLWRNRRNRRMWITHLKKAGRWLVTGTDEKSDAKKAFNDLVGADLALKFGILPTANLLFDSVEQYSRLLPSFFREQVTIKASTNKTVAGAYGGEARIDYHRSQRAVCYIWLKPDTADYTAGNLAEALWAGTRLSFMLDWFFNVGSYLSALDAMSNVERISGVLSTRDNITIKDTRVPYHTTPWHVSQAATRRYYSTQRSVISSVPLPRLWDNFNAQTTDALKKLLSSVEVLVTMRKRT